MFLGLKSLLLTKYISGNISEFEGDYQRLFLDREKQEPYAETYSNFLLLKDMLFLYCDKCYRWSQENSKKLNSIRIYHILDRR